MCYTFCYTIVLNIFLSSGPNCDEQLTSRTFQEKGEAGIGNVVAGVFAAIMVIAISLAAWFYHRRRVADLKKEMVQVQYIAEPVTPPGMVLFFFNFQLKLKKGFKILGCYQF